MQKGQTLKSIGVFGFLAFFFALGCGSGSSSTAATVSSLSDIPDVRTMVKGAATSNLAAPLANTAKAVSGTPPLLTGITGTAAKNLFWGSDDTDLVGASENMIDAVIAANTASQTQESNFWPMEGSCRMAQNVGYSMQNILQAGASLCYMRGMPSVSSGVSVTPSLADTSTIFQQQTSSSRLVAVNPTGSIGEESLDDQTIFIRVFGSNTTEGSAGYAYDIWFCGEGSSTPSGYEQFRYNSTTGDMTSTMVETSFANFQLTFAAKATNTNGTIEFDASSDRTATFAFTGTFGGMTFTDKGVILVSGSRLTSKMYHTDDNFTFFNYSVSRFTGDSVAQLRFLDAAYKGQNVFGGNTDTYEGGAEYQTSRYVPLSGDDLTNMTLYQEVTDYSFATDSFFDTAPAIDTSGLSGYNCSETADFTVTMDFTDAAVAAVAATCENDFSDMNFCDGTDVQSARNIIFQSGNFGDQ